MRLLFLSLLALSLPSFGSIVAVDSYTFLTTSNPDYNDASGSEMTDGETDSAAWGYPSRTITFGDVAALTGWQDRNAKILFDFGVSRRVQSITVWAADSNGAAGVAFPSSITISTPDSSFSQTFAVSDPAGSGSTRAIVLSGFSVDSDQLIVEAIRASQFVMLSEVQFNSVPEPSATLLSLFSLLLLRRRRV